MSKENTAIVEKDSEITAKSSDPIDNTSFVGVDRFPDYEDIEHGTIYSLSLKNDTSRYTHGMHRFAAKYIPQVPEWAIQNFSNSSDLILDPFMGSGTTLVEGVAHGLNVCGIDIDPLARGLEAVLFTDASNL